jgi:hypothetical protein
MDPSERCAANFLAQRGYKNVVYEPDGNVPPDFLVVGYLAVEVRRLNQNFDFGTRVEGLEQASIPLWKKIQALAASLGPPKHGVSWFVFYSFTRPLEPWKLLKPKIRDALLTFMNDPAVREQSWKLSSGFELEVFRATKLFPTFFVMAGHVDDDAGGWVIPELLKNLAFCIGEKSKKIEKFKSRYPAWWLVLVDHVYFGREAYNHAQVRKNVQEIGAWNKVVVINAESSNLVFEI